MIIYLFGKVTDYDLLNPNVALCKLLKKKKKSAKDELNVAIKQAVINHRFSAENSGNKKVLKDYKDGIVSKAVQSHKC